MSRLEIIFNDILKENISLAENLAILLDKTAQLQPQYTQLLRGTLLRFLKLFTFLEENSKQLDREGDAQEIILPLFGEVMRDPQLLCDFWRDLNERNDALSEFVWGFLGRFPFDTAGFLDMVTYLSGSRQMSFHAELMEILGDLEVISSERMTLEEERVEREDRHGLEMYLLKRPVEIQAGIVVPENTHFYYSPDETSICFLGRWNFWSIVWNQLTSLVNRSNPEFSLNDDFRKMIVFLAKTVEESPNSLPQLEGFLTSSNVKSEAAASDDESEEKKLRLFLEKIRMNVNSVQDTEGMMTMLLLLELLRIVSDNDDNEEMLKPLLSAILRLLESTMNFKMQLVMHFHTFMCTARLNLQHPLLVVQSQIDRSQQHFERISQMEGVYLELHRLLIQISAKLIEPDDVFFTQIRSPDRSSPLQSQTLGFNSEKSYSMVDFPSLQKIIEKLNAHLSGLYENLITSPCWDLQQSNLIPLLPFFNIREYYFSNGFLDSVIYEILIPATEKIHRQALEVNEENLGRKFALMSSIMNFVEVLVSKLGVVHGAWDLNAKFTPDKQERIFEDSQDMAIFEKLTQYFGSCRVSDLIIECLECRISTDSFSQSQTARALESSNQIGNKHWVLNVIQKKCESGREEIREYLISGIELLNTCIRAMSSVPQFSENDLFEKVRSIIGQKQHIHKFSFSHNSKSKSANLLVAICSLANFEEKKGLLRPGRRGEWTRNMKFQIIEDLFTGSISAGVHLKKLKSYQVHNLGDPSSGDLQVSLTRSKRKELLAEIRTNSSGGPTMMESIWNRLQDDEHFMKASCLRQLSQSCSSFDRYLNVCVVRLLSSLMVYWSFQSKLDRPDLFEFLSGEYNDLPNAQSIFQS